MLSNFANRESTFHVAASQSYAEFMAKARSARQTISASDSYIAATAAANAMAVATRDTTPFSAAGLRPSIRGPFRRISVESVASQEHKLNGSPHKGQIYLRSSEQRQPELRFCFQSFPVNPIQHKWVVYPLRRSRLSAWLRQ